jgi:hypothetical protein
MALSSLRVIFLPQGFGKPGLVGFFSSVLVGISIGQGERKAGLQVQQGPAHPLPRGAVTMKQVGDFEA